MAKEFRCRLEPNNREHIKSVISKMKLEGYKLLRSVALKNGKKVVAVALYFEKAWR